MTSHLYFTCDFMSQRITQNTEHYQNSNPGKARLSIKITSLQLINQFPHSFDTWIRKSFAVYFFDTQNTHTQNASDQAETKQVYPAAKFCLFRLYHTSFTSFFISRLERGSQLIRKSLVKSLIIWQMSVEINGQNCLRSKGDLDNKTLSWSLSQLSSAFGSPLLYELLPPIDR